MHVHQQQSQTCKMGKLPALREVKHLHRDRTSVSRSPSTEQEVLSQFSSYSEEIEHFTRDPCKPHLKSCLQSTKHAFKKQEVNTHTDCEHSYRIKHAKHFPAPMEMCMDDHLTQTTERIQRQHLQDKTYEQNCLTHNILPDFTFSHTEFPPGMENTPSFPGKQFLQGKEEFTLPDMENEKNMDTCTFTSGSTTLNRHSMLSTLTYPRRVPQNFQQLEMESSNMVALPCFNHNAETITHMETPRNVHDKGTLSNNLKMDTNMNANMDTNHMAHQYRHTEKEAHLLSEPSELQPLKAMAHRCTEKEAHLLSEPSELRPLKAMIHRHTGKKPTFFQDHQNSNRLRTQELRSSEVQHRASSQDKNTADSQKQKKLSFRPHLLIMMKETLSGTILSINFHLTLST